jgi:DNA-binding IclR family transcriptional regulator
MRVEGLEDEAASAARSAYAVPALEKALDIIELLAVQSAGLTSSQIASALGRSVSEIFRILHCLNRRRIIERRQPGDRFLLTVRLLEMGLAHPPVDRLLTTAIPVMQEMAVEMYQTCHLAVHNGGHILIVAQVASPASIGFSSRRGARFPLTTSISGRVLLAFRKPVERQLWLREAAEDAPDHPPPPDLEERLEAIRRQGYELSQSPAAPGITDASAPIIDDSGDAVAALTVPYFATAETRVGLNELPLLLCKVARRISDELGGSRQHNHIG